MTASEKVAYLKGLIEGAGIDSQSGEGRLFSMIADILGDMSSDIVEIAKNARNMADDIDTLSNGLSSVEDIVYDDNDFGFDEDGDEDDGNFCCRGCCADDDDERGFPFFEVTCPACDNTITVDKDVLSLGSIQCPNCGEMMEFDLDGDDEDEQVED